MTREEEARIALAAVVDTAGRRTYAKLVRLSVDNRDRFGGSEVIAAMLAYGQQRADAEAAAMRERAAGVCDGLASSAANIQAALELYGSEAPTKAIQRKCATTLAAAIRGLPVGEAV